MNVLSLCHEEIPSFLFPYLRTDAMQRLKGIDMNCGMNFTSFPLFRDIQPYSRYEHSLGVALIVWHFTHDQIQTLAGLFHDISTTAFSHVTDFMKGDYLKQEASENETSLMIQNDTGLMKQLSEDGIDVSNVCDYHMYPVADNDSPHLSADRLEYTFGDVLDYHFGTAEQLKYIYDDLVVLKNEEGMDEIGFLHADTAYQFAQLALKCGKVYSSKEDRYAMDRLSDLLKECVKDHTLTKEDLYDSEEHVIAKICVTHEEEWNHFSSLSRVDVSDVWKDGYRTIQVKKRYIDPLVSEKGRVHELNRDLNESFHAFCMDDMKEWLKGDTY